MKMKKILALCLVALLLLGSLCACGKENKYVNVGVEMSVPGMSLYLTNTANKLESISTYMYMEETAEATVAKLSKDKQGIDIAYMSAEDLSAIKADNPLTVIFVDTFGADGSIAGVWVARNNWLTDAPNYSYRYVRGLVKSVDYRAANCKMTYAEAKASVAGKKDIRFSETEGNSAAMVVTDVMQYVAAFEEANKDVIEDKTFTFCSAQELLDKLTDGSLETALKALYAGYSGGKTYEELFDMSLMEKALHEVLDAE